MVLYRNICHGNHLSHSAHFRACLLKRQRHQPANIDANRPLEPKPMQTANRLANCISLWAINVLCESKYSPMRCEKWKSFFLLSSFFAVFVLVDVYFFTSFYFHTFQMEFSWLCLFCEHFFTELEAVLLSNITKYLQFVVNIDKIWAFRFRLVFICLWSASTHWGFRFSLFFVKHYITSSFLTLWIWKR